MRCAACRHWARALASAAFAALVAGLTLALLTAPSLRAQGTDRSARDTVGAPVGRGAGRGTVRTDTLWSQSLGVHKALTVYLPPSYGTGARRYPLLVYLHGLTGNERNWVDAGQLPRTMDSLIAAGGREAIIAMPDGDDGWYTTWASLPDATCAADTVRKEPARSYCVPWPHYDDYIARDVVAHVDRAYRTVADRAHRGIAGLSMGGYGAITLAMAYPDVFSAAASHSGVLSPRLRLDASATDSVRYGRDRRELQQGARSLWPSQRRAFGTDTIAWRARDPRVLAERLLRRVRAGEATLPALHIDVGVDDPWIRHNRDFTASLTALGVPHVYREHPGAHTWAYWREQAAASVQFLLGAMGRGGRAGACKATAKRQPREGDYAKATTRRRLR